MDEARVSTATFPVVRDDQQVAHRRTIHHEQRVAIFVDVQNMFYSARNLYQRKLNFAQLMDMIVAGRRLIRAIAYVVQSPDVDQGSFLYFLSQTGYEVKSKELLKRADGSAKGDWDMGIAIDSISMADKIDVVALVSGDGDFCDLIDHLKARGMRCEVYAFPGSASEKLRYSASEFIPLDANVLLYP